MDHFKFFLSTHDHNPVTRPRTKQEFQSLVDISKNYQFIAHKRGIVFARQRSCWCMPCVQGFIVGGLHWRDTHDVPNCSSASLNKGLFQYTKRPCRLLNGAEAREQQTQVHESRKERAKNLKVGDWVIFQAPEGESERVWLGQIRPYEKEPSWNKKGVWVNEGGGNKKWDDQNFGNGAVALHVAWYDPIESPVQTYDFKLNSVLPPVIQHHHYLLFADFKMNEMVRHGSRPQASRGRLTRSLAQQNHNEWRLAEKNRVWRMPSVVMEEALIRCDELE